MIQDLTLEKLVDMLMRCTQERDQLRTENAKLHRDLWHRASEANELRKQLEPREELKP